MPMFLFHCGRGFGYGPSSLSHLDPISDTFGHHDDGGIGISPHNVGHDGRIHHTEPIEPTHVTILINYRSSFPQAAQLS
jgi:hypothetical protein